MITALTPKPGYKTRMSSKFEQYTLINSEFDRARMAQSTQFDRMYRNHKMYFGIDGGQWNDEELERLRRENRHADTFNIVGPKVDTLAGSIASNGFDTDLKPIAGPRTSVIEAERDSYLADRELCDFSSQKSRVIRDAMIHSGELKMIKSTKFSGAGLGNISFVRCTPGFVIRDPHWISEDDADCQKVWEIFHLSAEDVARKFKVRNKIIDHTIQMDIRMGGQYQDVGLHRDPTQSIQRAYKGHLHRVIEYHYLDYIETTRLQGQVLGTTRWVVFPITNDHAKLEKFMTDHNVDPETMEDKPYSDIVHRVATICPTLMPNEILEDGIAAIQPRRLPYFHLTSNRSGGLDKGVVDDVADIQTTINKREMKITHLIGTANGGGKLIPRSLFKKPDELKEFLSRANDPSYVGVVDGDVLNENPIHYLNSMNYPGTIIDQINRMYDIVDRVSKVPAAMEAMSESANESGTLFNMKMEVAQLGLITINNAVKKWEKDIAEAYLFQWQIDPHYNGVEREMSTSDGKHKTVLNERVYKNGEIWIRNRPQDIPRCTVVITESKNNPTKRLQDRAFYQELYEFARQNNPDSIYVSYLFVKIMETSEMTERDKTEFDMIKRVQQELDLHKVKTEIDNLEATSAQSALVELQSLMEAEQLKASGQTEIPISETPQPNQPSIEQTNPQPGPASQ